MRRARNWPWANCRGVCSFSVVSSRMRWWARSRRGGLARRGGQFLADGNHCLAVHLPQHDLLLLAQAMHTVSDLHAQRHSKHGQRKTLRPNRSGGAGDQRGTRFPHRTPWRAWNSQDVITADTLWNRSVGGQGTSVVLFRALTARTAGVGSPISANRSNARPAARNACSSSGRGRCVAPTLARNPWSVQDALVQ